MGYNSVRTDPIEKLFSRQERLQNILLLSSIILCLIALANFSICIWIRYVKTKMGQIDKMKGDERQNLERERRLMEQVQDGLNTMNEIIKGTKE